MPVSAERREAGFRTDIECLRGVAVLSVVLYHAFPNLLPGGYVGVDIFFVISGFLITGILLRDLARTGRISLLEFWARRSRRILPASSLVLVVTAIAAALTVSPLDLGTVYQDVIAAALYVVNWRLASQAVDYLAQGEATSLVLHYWSLSIEEQFYIVFPLVLAGVALAARRLAPGFAVSRLPVAMIATFWVVSLAYCIYLTGTDQPLAFFDTGARAWQLMTGGLIAALSAPVARLRPPARLAFGTAGVGFIGWSLLMLSVETPYPGTAAMVPTLAAGAVIMARLEPRLGPRNVWSLAALPLSFAGRYSYAWYLWHWPVLSFGHAWLGTDGTAVTIALAILSLGLAVLTQHLVENPIRFHPALMASHARSLAVGALLTASAAASGGAVAWLAANAAIPLPGGDAIAVADLKDDVARSYADGCHLSFAKIEHPPCVYGRKDAEKTVMLFGDSHAAQWLPALDKAAERAGFRLVSRTKSSCPPFDLPVMDVKRRREYSVCRQWQADVMREIAAGKPAVVVMAAYFDYYLGEAVIDPTLDGNARRERLSDAIRNTVAEAQRHAGRVFVMKDTPRYGTTPLRCVLPGGGRVATGCSWPLDRQLGTFIPRLPPGGPASVLDLNPAICPEARCEPILDGLVVMRDDHHLTARFSATLAPTFEPFLRGGD